MPIPATIDDLSATAASNSPLGSDPPTEGDNHLRALAAIIRQVYDANENSLSINAKMGYGAVGDGSTDDLASIQAAIDAAEAIVLAYSGVGGIDVLIPGGEYKLSSGLTITEDNIILRGVGPRSTCLLIDDAFDVITITGTIGSGARDLGIRAATGTDLSSNAYFVLSNVSGGRFENLDLRGWFNGFDCLGVTRCLFSKVYGSQIGRETGIGNDLIKFRGTADTGLCSGNRVTDCEAWNSSDVAQPAYSAFVRASSSDGLYISENHAVGGDYGVLLAPTGLVNNDTMASVSIVHNYFDTCETNNINLQGEAAEYRDIKIVGNTLRASAGAALVATPDAASTLVGFQVIGNQIRSSGTVGLSLGDDNIEGAVIKGNVFNSNNTTSNASGHDITIRGDGHIISGNVFIAGDATGSCISLTADARNFVCKDNNFSRTTRGTKVTNNASATTPYILGPNLEQSLGAVIEETKTGQSTNDTPLALWSYAMEEESILTVDAEVVGARSTYGAGTAVKVHASFLRNGSDAPAQIGTDTDISTQETSASYLVDVDVSTNTVRIMVTGLDSGNDNWVARVRAITHKT